MRSTSRLSTIVRTPDGRALHVYGLRRTGTGVPSAGEPTQAAAEAHAVPSGSASPRTLVVLESGLGVSGRFWGPVQRSLAASTSALVLAYDRAGHGRSDPDPAPRTLQRLADDLETVVHAVPHDRLLLVGHSWGGPIVRTLAARLDARGAPPAGVVLVDPADENCDLYFVRSTRASGVLQDLLYMPLALTGLLQPLGRAILEGLPSADRDAAARASSTLAAARATIAENRMFTREMRGLLSSPPDLGEAPVTIISGTSTSQFDDRMRRLLNEAHRLSAQSLLRGHVVEADRSGHMVPITEPQLVVREIRALLDA